MQQYIYQNRPFSYTPCTRPQNLQNLKTWLPCMAAQAELDNPTNEHKAREGLRVTLEKPSTSNSILAIKLGHAPDVTLWWRVGSVNHAMTHNSILCQHHRHMHCTTLQNFCSSQTNSHAFDIWVASELWCYSKAWDTTRETLYSLNILARASLLGCHAEFCSITQSGAIQSK